MDFFLNELAEKSIEYAISQGADYCDARAEKQTRKSALIENSEIEHVREASDDGIGIRLLKNDAWGFFAISNPDDFEKIKISIDRTIKNVAHYSEKKKTHTKLVPIKIKKVTKNFPVLEKPDLDSMIKVGLECDKIILGQPKVRKSTVTPWYSENLKYFVSSEGCEITQIFTDVVIEMAAIAHESGLTQSINVTEGGRGGMEQITRNNLAQTSASNISTKASELLDSIPAKEEKTTLVMNPDFVSLLTHEILGHPSEADRVLGKEMAWAGGAWWKDKIGEKIGSEELNVFDDPTIPESLGWYYFDDEGVEARKTTLVENGTLKNHLQSRETASHFDVHPTANMRSTSYRFMPLIRMACTCIQEGNWSPDDMIRDVKNGYLISNMKIPSIDMKRYNWSISCQYAQKIECGEITDLVRDVIVMGTAPEFFQSIDACGNDFTVRPITNCGKGDPMQSMIMGNGGPSIRGIATIKSVN